MENVEKQNNDESNVQQLHQEDYKQEKNVSLEKTTKSSNIQWSKIVQIVVNIAVLITSIAALVIALKSYKNTNKQNLEIVANLEKIQINSGKQTEIIDQQLKITNQMFNEQLNAGSPKIVFQGLELTDEQNVNKCYAPKISARFKNEGKRYAYNFKHRFIVVTYDFSEVTTNDMEASNNIGPNSEYNIEFLPKIDTLIMPLYCIIEISFLDNTMGKIIKDNYYFKYSMVRNVKQFYDCDNKEKILLKVKTNSVLKANKSPLLQ